MIKKDEKVIDRRTYLYKKGEEPRIFDGDEEVKAAMEEGWVDSPDKVDEPEKEDPGKKKTGKKSKLDGEKVDAGQDIEPTGESYDGV